MSSAVSSLISKAGSAWCELMHQEIMWPVEGYYRCRTCLREYPVAWNDKTPVAQAVPVKGNFTQTAQLGAAGLRS